jgi:carbonic anhydrase/acetyltransferase-like protein (isoleucine patch superfamily)
MRGGGRSILRQSTRKLDTIGGGLKRSSVVGSGSGVLQSRNEVFSAMLLGSSGQALRQGKKKQKQKLQQKLQQKLHWNRKTKMKKKKK